MKALRWLLMVPAGVAILWVMSVLVPLVAAVGSLDIPLAFWDAADMGEWWVSGTIALIIWRGGSAALSTWAVFRIAPDHKSAAAGVWAALLVALAVFWLGEITMGLRITGSSLSFGHWYRLLVEGGALVAGSLLTYFDMRSSAGDLDSADFLRGMQEQPSHTNRSDRAGR